jgi:glycosyltransferase involved in cell wall biosynthesis
MVADQASEQSRRGSSAGIVSALVCTRNRAESLVRTVRSLLKTDAPRFELIVMDQSDGDETERALRVFSDDPRLRHVRSSARGKGAALNEGLRLALGGVVVCTDDDCEAPPNWARDMTSALELQPAAAILFCNVAAGPHDRTAGYVPAYDPCQERVLRSIAAARHGLGLGAGMALRRQAVLEFGGFDETFGPGSRFASGDDWDLALRALLRGWHVCDTDRISIVHHGFRTFEEGRDHALRDWIAIGALWAKPVRAGHGSAVIPALGYFLEQAVWPPMFDVLRLRPPSGRSRIVGFVRGFAEGIRTPVDPETLFFRSAG